ncbi:hypothetical protein Tco_1493654 [Tanacetum coccineum]
MFVKWPNENYVAFDLDIGDLQRPGALCFALVGFIRNVGAGRANSGSRFNTFAGIEKCPLYNEIALPLYLECWYRVDEADSWALLLLDEIAVVRYLDQYLMSKAMVAMKRSLASGRDLGVLNI